jgi:sporulation protein YlmC with PRC-barrel domain
MGRDIRFIARDCILINDLSDLTDPADIIRLPVIIKDSYDPIGKKMVTESGKRLGKIDNYTVNLDSGRVQKLYAQPILLQSWFGSSVIVDRNQIVDLSDTAVVVKDAAIGYSEPSNASLISAKPKP